MILKMSSDYIKTESIADKHKRYEIAIEYWYNNKHLNRVQVCEKFGFTESAMRSHMKRYNIQRPDGFAPNVSAGRRETVRDAYNMCLDKDMTAAEASSWATKKHGSKIGRAEIQFYATKFDLPYLREAETFEMGKISKYG